MPRITFCTYDWSDFPCAGPTVWLDRLVTFLYERGAQIQLLVLSYGEAHRCPLVRRFAGTPVVVRALEVRQHPYVDCQVRWILRQAADFKPDVFCPNLVTAGMYAARYCERAGVPSVAVLHSPTEFYHSVVRRFYGMIARPPLTALVAVAEDLTRFARENSRPGTCIRRISCGCPVPAAGAVVHQGTLHLLYAGRLVAEHKRVLEIARVMRDMADRWKDVECTICGKGSQRDEVEQIVRGAGANPRIRLIDALPHAQVQDFMMRHQVFLLLSDCEGMPVALLEAMACGLVPICVAGVPGIREVVRHDENGILVHDRHAGVMEAVDRLRRSPALWERLSREARRTVVENYSQDIENAKWWVLVRELSTTRRGSRRIHAPVVLRLPEPPLTEGDVRRAPLPSRLRDARGVLWRRLRQWVRPRARWRE